MAIKVLLGYGFNDVGPYRPGFSEVHFWLGGATNTKDAQLNLDVVELMNARTQLMGNNVRATMYRLSRPGVPRRHHTVYATGSPIIQSQLNKQAGVDQGPSDLPNACVMGTVRATTGQSRKIYMAGLPDALIRTNPVGPDWGAASLTGYQALWQSWNAVLTNGKFGFYCLNQLPNGQPLNISRWQQSNAAPFNVQFVIPNDAAYKPNVGEIVHVRGVLMGVTGLQAPIGTWRVKAKGAVDDKEDFYELDKSDGYQAILVDDPGTVESVSRGYQAYAEVENWLQTTRKRGIGPVRPRGRSRPRRRRQAV